MAQPTRENRLMQAFLVVVAALFLIAAIDPGGGGGGSQTLDQTFTLGNVIDGASVVKPLKICNDGAACATGQGWQFYTTAGGDAIAESLNPADNTPRIPTNFDWCLYDVENAECVVTANPDAVALGSGSITYRDPLSAPLATGTKSAAYTIGTDDPAECYGGVIYVDTAATITACTIDATNMYFTVISQVAGVVILEVDNADRMRLDGTALDDGDVADSTGASGDFIVCSKESAAGWECLSGSTAGTKWADGGAV